MLVGKQELRQVAVIIFLFFSCCSFHLSEAALSARLLLKNRSFLANLLK